MPLTPNTTKNDVDLNEIDVKNLTLVDKGQLLDELSKKLRGDIVDAFNEATDSARQDIGDMMKGNRYGSHGMGGGGGYSNAPRSANNNSKDQFQDIRKAQAAAQNVVGRLVNLQKNKDKESRLKQLRGSVYSDAGKKLADQADNIGSNYQHFDNYELDDAKKKLSDIQEKIRFTTVGKENDILSNATIRLQQALDEETRKRTTVLGRIGVFMNKSNIDVVSVISGFASHSPLVGMMTKYMLDTIREHKEKKQRDKANSLKVGDIKKMLPRADEPQMDDSNVKIETSTAEEGLAKISQNPVLSGALEELERKGHITPEQHAMIRAKVVSPDFTATPAAAAPPPMPAASGVNPSSPTPVSANNPNSPSVIKDAMGMPVRDWQGYLKGTTKKEQGDDEILGWLNYINEAGMRQQQQNHENRKIHPKPDWHDEELFGDWHAKPSALAHMERMQAQRLKNPYNNPIPFMMGHDAAPAPPPIVQQDLGNVRYNGPAVGSSPERLPTDNASLFNLANGVEEKQELKVGMFGGGDGPLSKLEKVNEDQLAELKQINVHLAKQISQADLAADAARRETKDSDGGFGSADMNGLNSKKSGGLLSTLFGLAGGTGGGGVGIMGRIARMVGAGTKGAAAGSGLLSRLIPSWLKRGVPGVSGAAGGAAEVGGAARVAEGVGAAGEAATGATGIIGKLGRGAKLFGKLAGPIGILMAIVDFIEGFINAERFFGNTKKLSTLDRVAGGVGNVVKNLVGIVDFVLGLAGVKTDLGGILGKSTANVLASVFKALGSIFSVLMKVAKPILSILGPILEYAATRLSKMFEIIGKYFDFLSEFYDGLSLILEGPFSDDPGKLLSEGMEKLVHGLTGMLMSLGDIMLNLLGMGQLVDAVNGIKDGFTTGLNNVADWIKKQIGIENFKILEDVLTKIRNVIMSPLNWIAEKLGIPIKKTQPTAAPTQPTAPAAPPSAAKQVSNTISKLSGADWIAEKLNLKPSPAPSSALAETAKQLHSPTSVTPSTAPSTSSVSPVSNSNAKIQYKPGVVPPEIAEMARLTEAKTGVPAAVTISQWALESGWGKHSIGNNPFGITKQKRHTKSQTKTTREDMTMAEFAQFKRSKPNEAATARLANGSPLPAQWSGKLNFKVDREFADFDTLEQAFEDHGRLLANPKGPYAAAMEKYKKTGDVNQYIRDIAPTYASDRDYGKIVSGLVNSKQIASASKSTGNAPVQAGSISRPLPTIASAPPPQPMRPESPELASLQGVRLTQATLNQSELQRQGSQQQPSSVVVAPQSTTTVQNNTHMVELRARNSDSAYQRNVDTNYVKT